MDDESRARERGLWGGAMADTLHAMRVRIRSFVRQSFAVGLALAAGAIVSFVATGPMHVSGAGVIWLVSIAAVMAWLVIDATALWMAGRNFRSARQLQDAGRYDEALLAATGAFGLLVGIWIALGIRLH